jgi:hypothetical protein
MYENAKDGKPMRIFWELSAPAALAGPSSTSTATSDVITAALVALLRAPCPLPG